MPHASLKIVGGVTVNETPTLNEAGISSCNLIRYMPDAKGLSLPQKLGGWAKFWATQITDAVRCIWPFQNTLGQKFIAYGTSNPTNAQLVAIECFTNSSTGITTASTTSSQIFNISPAIATAKVGLNIVATASTNTVVVTDPLAALVTFSSVYIVNPVRVGGATLQGLYGVQQTQSTSSYEIFLPIDDVVVYDTTPVAITNIVWNSGGGPLGINFLVITVASDVTSAEGEWIRITGVTPSVFNGVWHVDSAAGTTTVGVDYPFPTATYISGGFLEDAGVPPIYFTAAGSNTVQVSLAGTNFVVGQTNTYNVASPTDAGGTSLFGNYTPSAPTHLQVQPTPFATWWFTINAAANATTTTQTFEGAINVTSGTGSGSSVTLNFAALSGTYNTPTITATSGTGTGSSVTLSWAAPATPWGSFLVGSYVLVSGATPSGWNGAWLITASSPTSVTFTNTVAGSLSGSATVGVSLFGPGLGVMVAGVTPANWNGYWLLTGATATSVTFANTTAGTASGPGTVTPNGGTADIIYLLSQATTNTVPLGATTWDLNNWGSDLVALPIGGNNTAINYGGGQTIPFIQPIYYWDSIAQPTSVSVMGNGPLIANGMFIAMPQRQVVAWGCSFTTTADPLLIAWCDVNDFTDWTPQVINQAGSFRIASGSRVVGALQLPQQGLIWTDIELWAMQYEGQPYVYGFNKIGISCGLIARRAMCTQNGFVYWMGQSQIYMLSGNGIQPVPCPVWDVAFQELDLAHTDKITAASNALFQEVTWYYPITGGNGEVTNYIKYNTITQTWDYGVLGRSAWTDESALGQPIGFDPSVGYLYQHEISQDADGSAIASTFTTGYFALSEGDMMTTIDQVWPDMKWGLYGQSQAASVQVTFNSVDYPGQTPKTYGPFTVVQGTSYISPRIRDRLVSITLSSDDVGSFWRLGNVRYRYQTDGKY